MENFYAMNSIHKIFKMQNFWAGVLVCSYRYDYLVILKLFSYIGVVFGDVIGPNLQYTIRPVHEVNGENGQSTWNTDIAQPRFQEPGPRFFPKSVTCLGPTLFQNLCFFLCLGS